MVINALLGLSKGIRPLSIPAARRSLSTSVESSWVESRPQCSPLYLKEELSPELQVPDYFGVRSLVSMPKLFEVGAHFGHKKTLRNPYMVPYLFGSRIGVDIFDLDKSTYLFQDALNVLAHVAYRGGVILFVSRNKQLTPEIEASAQKCGEYAHCREWKSGTFTNSSVVFGSIMRLPDICVFFSTQNTIFRQHDAVIESAKLLIPTVGFVDSDCDPRLISYPIPVNDDTPTAVRYYLNAVSQAILLGKKQKAIDMKKSEQVKVLP